MKRSRNSDDYRAFDDFLRRGSKMHPASRALLEQRAAQYPELRAQGTLTGSTGGYLVPQEIQHEYDVALKWASPMVRVAEIIETASGADLPYPTTNDTGQSGELVAENVQTGQQDAAFGTVLIKTFLFSSKRFLVSNQLLQDSSIDVVALIVRLGAERIARALNPYLTVGTGTSQPHGVVPSATVGVTAGTGHAADILYDDIAALFHALDPAYRESATWMFRDSTFAALRKLKDTANLPLLAGLNAENRAGWPPTIFGRRVVVNPDVAAMAANAKSLLFGDFSRYKFRTAGPVQIIRIEELYADYNQTAFLVFQRCDGNLIDAGTRPVLLYQNSAT